MNEHVDVLVVGAGLSGIGAGYHLQTLCPKRSYAILEGRSQLGGTWDLFRYPGIRSDSDMYTLGFVFKPWTHAKAIADGPAILQYLNETAREHGIDRKIRYRHWVERADWSSQDARWTVDISRGENKERVQMTCNFLFTCSGYYNYENGYTPPFADIERFAGRIVHPQHWSDDIDYAGKRVVVIGSGATAVTLVPELAKHAAHVTMLQRSPTYIVSRPSQDAIANKLRALLPARVAYSLTRWKNVLYGMWIYALSRRKPDAVRDKLLSLARAELGPDYDIATHLTPRYNPWDQRLCLVPDSDLFKALKANSAEIVTDQIDRFNQRGIALKSGKQLDADLIITATGLDLKLLGGMAISVDGARVELPATISYKGMMFSGVPNLASSFGYTNASWTLRADLICEYVCRLLNHMERTGTRQCTPRLNDPGVTAQDWVSLTSGYFQRSQHKLPKQGSKAPWQARQNYVSDLLNIKFARVDDGVMEFGNAIDHLRNKTVSMT